ncbi:hypothetical protein FBALC1_11502 [Flavobacteriales bacterium ALC-1]|nr:hypothetical protein FBALC1_11502 [Flavobacteriales bacterium ALC-1]
MKNIFYVLLLLGFSMTISAQDQPKVGDELVIEKTSAQRYTYIKFPKLNILSKRGKVANYKSVYKNSVVIDEIVTKENEPTYVILKKKDGTKFFGYLAKVKANYAEAIHAGELSKVQS